MQRGRRSMQEASAVQLELETDVGLGGGVDVRLVAFDGIEEGRCNIRKAVVMQRIEGLLNYVADGRDHRAKIRRFW